MSFICFYTPCTGMRSRNLSQPSKLFDADSPCSDEEEMKESDDEWFGSKIDLISNRNYKYLLKHFKSSRNRITIFILTESHF